MFRTKFESIYGCNGYGSNLRVNFKFVVSNGSGFTFNFQGYF